MRQSLCLFNLCGCLIEGFCREPIWNLTAIFLGFVCKTWSAQATKDHMETLGLRNLQSTSPTYLALNRLYQYNLMYTSVIISTSKNLESYLKPYLLLEFQFGHRINRVPLPVCQVFFGSDQTYLQAKSNSEIVFFYSNLTQIIPILAKMYPDHIRPWSKNLSETSLKLHCQILPNLIFIWCDLIPSKLSPHKIENNITRYYKRP